MSASRQLSAVLFIDIAGYTAIMQEDEALALATVGFFRDTLQEAAPKWRGQVIQFYGDGCLLIFNSAVDAVQFSIEVQAAFKKDQPVPARIGLHLGDIILKEGNVFGDPVNIAARIQALAAPGQIFLSGTIHQAIANKKEFTTRFIREENLKNVKEAVPVYELVQDGKAVPVIKKKRRSNTGRSVKTNVMIAASVILIAILAFIGTKFLQGRSSVIENSIAVLPFVDMSRTQDQEYFGDGLAEQIINSLTTVNELKVIGRTSSFQFKGQNLDLRKIGKTLNVGLILEGSIQVDGKKLRITAQLIRVSDNTHIWSQQYDRELTEIFRIQDDIALQITDRLKIALTDQQKQNLAMRETDPAAYQLFLKGTHAYRQQDFLKSIDYQLAAIKIDSLFALPYAYISLSKAWIISRSRDFQNVGAIESAKEYALKSVELAKTPEGYSALGLISWRIERRFATAKEYFEKSLEGNSNSSLIKNRFAYYLVWSGEFERARQLAQEAMVSDPIDYNSYVIMGTVYLYTGNYQAADKLIGEAKKLLPDNIPVRRLVLLNEYFQQRYDSLVKYCEAELATMNAREDQLLALQSIGYYKLNKTTESDLILQQMRSLPLSTNQDLNYWMARAFIVRGQRDSCLDRLKQAFQRLEPVMSAVKVDPFWKGLRDDEEYKKMVEEYGFKG